MARHRRGSAQATTRTKTPSSARKSQGWWSAVHRPPPTAASSVTEAAQFETGSGEVLITTRVPALVAWVAALSPPPTRPAANWAAGPTSPTAAAARTAPAGIRTKVLSASQAVSTPGVLSAKNSTTYMKPAAVSTRGLVSAWSSAGSCTLPVAPRSPRTNTAA